MSKNTTAVVKKTSCPVTAADFASHAAKALAVNIAGQPMAAMLAGQGTGKFSTGSLGWNASGKMVLEVNGVPVVCQVGLNITVIGSKPQA